MLVALDEQWVPVSGVEWVDALKLAAQVPLLVSASM
jgi:hypothetical protein